MHTLATHIIRSITTAGLVSCFCCFLLGCAPTTAPTDSNITSTHSRDDSITVTSGGDTDRPPSSQDTKGDSGSPITNPSPNGKPLVADDHTVPPNPATLPLLPSGSFVSTIISFESLPPTIDFATQTRWHEAISAGMQVARIHLDWADVEPVPEQYDTSALKDRLLQLEADGLRPFVALYAMDTEGMVMPSDLQAPFLSGAEIDDSLILRRYRKLLDWAAPMIVRHGGWGLSIANEVDDYLLANPAKTTHVANFYRNARAYVHALSPALAVTATHSQIALLPGASHYPALAQELDFACFNYYPIDFSVMQVYEPTLQRVNADIQKMLTAANGKQLVLQELGCPAGYADSSYVGSSALTQQQFFANVFSVLRTEPRFRVAFVFQMVDWSPGLVAQVYGPPENPFGFALKEWLVTSGLITYDSATARPAWSVFISAL